MIEDLADNVYWVMREAKEPACINDVIQDLVATQNRYWIKLWKVNTFDPSLAHALIHTALLYLESKDLVEVVRRSPRSLAHLTLERYWRVRNLLEVIGMVAGDE